MCWLGIMREREERENGGSVRARCIWVCVGGSEYRVLVLSGGGYGMHDQLTNSPPHPHKKD